MHLCNFFLSVLTFVFLSIGLAGCEAAPPSDPGAEVFLYPKAEADIDAYGICRHVRNATNETITAFGVTPRTWSASHSATAQGVLMYEESPCE